MQVNIVNIEKVSSVARLEMKVTVFSAGKYFFVYLNLVKFVDDVEL